MSQELMLYAYNSLICYKLSDDGVSRPRLRLVVTVRQRKVWRYTGCRRTLPWAVKDVGYFKKMTRLLIDFYVFLFIFYYKEHAVNCRPTITPPREVKLVHLVYIHKSRGVSLQSLKRSGEPCMRSVIQNHMTLTRIVGENCSLLFRTEATI